MNKSSSLLLQLYFHLLHFLIVNKSSYSKKEKRKKKKEKRKKKKKKEIFKKDLRTRGIGLILLRLLSKKKKKNHQSKFSILWKNSRFPKFSKKKILNFQFLRKIQVFQIKKKKKKKKSLLNSTSGTKSYDPLPRSPVMQHQVNYPPSAFIEAWSMSQTRGIHQVCRILFNE